MDESSFTTVLQKSPFPRRVITLHGIRTTGAWQKELNDTLEEHQLRHSPFDYGYLKLPKFLNPGSRDGEINRFRDWVSKYISAEHQPHSIIAHSFGTYIVTQALLKYEELKLDRLILCGSIVDKEYPWTKIIERGQVRGVLNECGTKDIWAKLAVWIVRDAGPSGVEGFSDKANGIVADVHRSGFRHSDFFYSLHVQNVWIPFINGSDVTELEKSGKSKRPRNIKFLATQIALVIFILSFAVLGKYYLDAETIRVKPTEDKEFKVFTSGKIPCPFGGDPRGKPANECVVMEVSTPVSKDLPKFHRTEGQLFYTKENRKCSYPTAAFAAIREDGNRCIIEAPNNITLYHTLNTVYYRPFEKLKAAMSKSKEGVDYYGEDYRDFPVKGEEGADICSNECALDERCKAFSFSVKANRCWLKDRIPKSRPDGDIVSGKKTGEHYIPSEIKP